MEEKEIISLLPAYLRNSSNYSLIVTNLEGKYIYVNEVRRHMVNIMGLYKLIKDADVLSASEKIEKLDLLLNETKELDQIIHAIVERSVGNLY